MNKTNDMHTNLNSNMWQFSKKKCLLGFNEMTASLIEYDVMTFFNQSIRRLETTKHQTYPHLSSIFRK
jgi:hypothetical protein